MGAKLQQNSNQTICLPHGAALPKCSTSAQPCVVPTVHVEKDWGIKGGPLSLDALEKNLSGFHVERDKKTGQTTLTFTARDPQFRIDYQHTNDAMTAGKALTDARSFVRTAVPGQYSLELHHNKDGSSTYTLKLDKSVTKAAITLGDRRFLIDPEKLKTPPVKITPLPAPATTPEVRPDPGYQATPDPEPAPRVEKQAPERKPAPVPRPEDPFEQKSKKPDPFETKPAEKIAEQKIDVPAKALTAKEAKAVEQQITRITYGRAAAAFSEDQRARFVPVAELERLIPKSAAERDNVIEPFKISVRLEPRGPQHNVYVFPTRNEDGTAGMTIIPWKSVKDSLDNGRYPKEYGAKQAINGAFVTLMRGGSVDNWWGVAGVAKADLPKGVKNIEGQVNTDGSVSLRRQEEQGERSLFNLYNPPTKPSADGKIYRPEFDANGTVSWTRVDGTRLENGRLAPTR